jgi:hypothetical protein
MNQLATVHDKKGFWAELHEQRWDDHRYYHQSRVNQSLHFISACSFVVTYICIAIGEPIWAAFMGWIVAMVTRQSGHFFFEPKGYDHVNDATHEHKEEIKVGYNLERKVVLLSIWAATPLIVHFDRTLFGLMEDRTGLHGYLWNLSLLWIWLGAIAVFLRTAYLTLTRNPRTGIVWATKILTDPFHDILLYHKAPLALMRGEWIDPMDDVRERQQR